MRLLGWIRGSYGALQLLYRLSGLINLFCRRFDREGNRAIRSRAELPPGLLNGQDTPELSDLPYGAWRMGRNGCEVIAAYNALLSLGRPRPLNEIAGVLEERGLMFNGFGGTNLGALTALFRRSGVPVRILRRRAAADYDAAFSGAACAVLSYWTGRTLRRRDGSWNTLHTVSVHHGENGVLICNANGRSRVPAEANSLAEFLSTADGDPVCLLLLGGESG